MNLDRLPHHTVGDWIAFDYGDMDPRHIEAAYDALRDNGYEASIGSVDNPYDVDAYYEVMGAG